MKFFKNISWIFTANLIASFTKWLILIFIARLLSPTDVGIYALALAIGAPITIFSNMKLKSLYVSEMNLKFSDYLYARNILNIVAISALMLITICFYPQYFFTIVIVGIMKIFDLQSDLYYALPYKNEDMQKIGKLIINKHLLTLFVFVIVLALKENLNIALTLQLIMQVFFFFFIEKRGISKKFKYEKNSFDLKNIKKLYLLGLPLGIAMMIASFNSSYPRFILESQESAKLLGIFSTIAYVLIIGNLVISAVSQVFLPKLTSYIQVKDYETFYNIIFKRLTYFSILLGGFIVLLSYFVGESLLDFIYGDTYGEYVNLLILLSIAMALDFVSVNFETALIAMRYVSVQPKISLFLLIVNISIAYFMIVQYGMYGAAYSIIVVNFIQLILRLYFSKRYYMRNFFGN